MEGTNTETQPHSCFTAVLNSGYYTDPRCDETRAKTKNSGYYTDPCRDETRAKTASSVSYLYIESTHSTSTYLIQYYFNEQLKR